MSVFSRRLHGTIGNALAARGMGTLLSTHNPDHALVCADRVMLLYDSRVIEQGPPEIVITRENLMRLYGVDVDVARFDSLTTQRMLCVPRFAERLRRTNLRPD